jgi:integrase
MTSLPIGVRGVNVTSNQELIERYRPNAIAADVWAAVAPTVRDVVSKADLRTLNGCRDALKAVSQFTAWVRAEGLPLDIETVFSPSIIDRYTAVGMPGYVPASRSTRRAQLRTIARTVTVTAPWEPKPESLRTKRMRAPYTAAEIDRLEEVAAQQPTPQRGRTASAFLAFGVGAGLRPSEMLTVSAEHVHHSHGVVVISVPGALARDVPVRTRWTTSLLDLVHQHPTGPLIGPFRTSRNRVNDLLGAVTRPGDVPPLMVHRARASWMIDVLNSGVPVAEFMRAVGWRAGSRLAELLPYLTCREPDVSWPHLAGGHD